MADKDVVNNFDTYQNKLLFNVLTGCAIIFLFALYFKFNSIIYVFLGLIGISALLFASMSWKNSLILFLSYLSMFPTYAWGSRYPFFRGSYFRDIFLIIFFVITIVWIIIYHANKFRVEADCSSLFDGILFIMLVHLLLAGVWGAYKGYDLKIIYLELLYFSLYFYYFFYKKYLRHKELLSVWKWITIITIIVSVQYIMLAFSESDTSSIFIARVVTQQPHLAQLCFPLLLSNVLFPNTMKKRLWSLVGIIPVTGVCVFQGIFYNFQIIKICFYFDYNQFSLIFIVCID